MTANPHGGRREGSGRKTTIGGKKVMVVLDQQTRDVLDILEQDEGWNHSQAIRICVCAFYSAPPGTLRRHATAEGSRQA